MSCIIHSTKSIVGRGYTCSYGTHVTCYKKYTHTHTHTYIKSYLVIPIKKYSIIGSDGMFIFFPFTVYYYKRTQKLVVQSLYLVLKTLIALQKNKEFVHYMHLHLTKFNKL